MHPSTAVIDLAKKSSSWPSPMRRAGSSGASAARAGRSSIRGRDVCVRSLLIHGAHDTRLQPFHFRDQINLATILDGGVRT